MHIVVAALTSLLAISPALAQEYRDLDAHEHGVGTLLIAVDGEVVAIEFEAPGADIVGFEHAAKTPDDRAAIERALSDLARPLALFTPPEAAGCTTTSATVALKGDDQGHDHDDGHDHGHSHEDSHGHAHDDEHSEFHATYVMTCEEIGALDRMAFGYFDAFGNARELDIQIVSDAGARAFKATRKTPTLDLRGMF